ASARSFFALALFAGGFTRPTGDLGLQLCRRTDHVETRSPPYVRRIVASMIRKAALLLGIAAVGSGEPTSFGTARLGTLTVTASVLVSSKAVDMRGVWNDT